MIRSLIACAALACSAMFAVPAIAATPLEPAIIHAVGNADATVVPADSMVAPDVAQTVGPVSKPMASTNSGITLASASVTVMSVSSYRVHIDPGRVTA